MTKARDALSTKRRLLPMVSIDKNYRFAGREGSADLADLFDGHRQLIVQHFMFEPTCEDGCSSCTAAAPLATIERYKAKRDGLSRGTPRREATSTTTSTSLSTPR